MLGKGFPQFLEVKKGTQKEFSHFNLGQSLMHLVDLPQPTPFCPLCRVHGPLFLLSRHRGDTGQAQAGKKSRVSVFTVNSMNPWMLPMEPLIVPVT